MAKKKPGKKKPPPPWARDWPRDGDVGAWMDALLAVAEHIADPTPRCTAFHLATHELSESGRGEESIAIMRRVIDGLPALAIHDRVNASVHAAELCFDHDNVDEMNRFLDLARDTAIRSKAAGKKYLLGFINLFKVLRGLLDPRDAVDEEEHTKAEFSLRVRRARGAIKIPDTALAIASAEDAQSLIPSLPHWARANATRDVAQIFHDANDRTRLEQLLSNDDTANKRERLDENSLLALGQRERAIARYEVRIRNALAELQLDTMNAHFPAMMIEMGIRGLVQIGQKDRARSLLREVLGEGESWILQNRGAFSSAVFRSLAKATLLVEGPEPARRLLDLAMTDAQGDDPSGWRTSAIRENLELLVELAPPDEAIDVAKTIRSHKDRRRILAPLLARAERWDELHEVINSAADAKEAADIIWWTKFVWRPAK